MPEEHPKTDSSSSVIERLRARVAEQAKLIEQLRQRIGELEARLAKDSHNSSKPPPRSQRKVSGRKPGGQKVAWFKNSAFRVTQARGRPPHFHEGSD
jgi:transposase